MPDKTFTLRYVGAHPTTFVTHVVGEVEPGGTFTVPESALLSFMRRGDVEHDGDCPAPPCKCGSEPETHPDQKTGSGTSGKPRGSRRGGGASKQDGQDGTDG